MIPQTIKSCNMQLIMPCFCAGANQTEPELRAASFRGELRWWFRCLGGTREQENAVFGNIHGIHRASAVSLLILNIKTKPNSAWEIENNPNRNDVNSSYITYFLSANKKNGDENSVVRTQASLPPDQKFTIELRQKHEISPSNMELLNLAWDCLCNLGAIGARKTRGLGSYAPVNKEEQKVRELIEHETVKKYFKFKLLDSKKYGNYKKEDVTTKILTDCAIKLKEYRKQLNIHPTLTKGQTQKKGAHYGVSALGNAIGDRQSSALRFRPVLIDNELYLCILKAPDITLSAKALEHNINI